MRSLLAVVLVAAACHPPSLRARVGQLGHGFANLGRGVAHLAVRVDPHVRVELSSTAVAMASEQAAQMAPQPEPEPDSASPDPDSASPDPDSAAPSPAPAPTAMPAMVVHRVDRSSPDVFVARYRTASGSWTCSTYSTMDECTRSCSAMNQQAGMTGAASPQCGCLEDGACP